MIEHLALLASLVLNWYLHCKRPFKHIKVYHVAPGVFAHKLKTRKIRKDS